MNFSTRGKEVTWDAALSLKDGAGIFCGASLHQIEGVFSSNSKNNTVLINDVKAKLGGRDSPYFLKVTKGEIDHNNSMQFQGGIYNTLYDVIRGSFSIKPQKSGYCIETKELQVISNPCKVSSWYINKAFQPHKGELSWDFSTDDVFLLEQLFTYTLGRSRFLDLLKEYQGNGNLTYQVFAEDDHKFDAHLYLNKGVQKCQPLYLQCRFVQGFWWGHAYDRDAKIQFSGSRKDQELFIKAAQCQWKDYTLTLSEANFSIAQGKGYFPFSIKSEKFLARGVIDSDPNITKGHVSLDRAVIDGVVFSTKRPVLFCHTKASGLVLQKSELLIETEESPLLINLDKVTITPTGQLYFDTLLNKTIIERLTNNASFCSYLDDDAVMRAQLSLVRRQNYWDFKGHIDRCAIKKLGVLCSSISFVKQQEIAKLSADVVSPFFNGKVHCSLLNDSLWKINAKGKEGKADALIKCNLDQLNLLSMEGELYGCFIKAYLQEDGNISINTTIDPLLLKNFYGKECLEGTGITGKFDVFRTISTRRRIFRDHTSI